MAQEEAPLAYPDKHVHGSKYVWKILPESSNQHDRCAPTQCTRTRTGCRRMTCRPRGVLATRKKYVQHILDVSLALAPALALNPPTSTCSQWTRTTRIPAVSPNCPHPRRGMAGLAASSRRPQRPRAEAIPPTAHSPPPPPQDVVYAAHGKERKGR